MIFFCVPLCSDIADYKLLKMLEVAEIFYSMADGDESIEDLIGL